MQRVNIQIDPRPQFRGYLERAERWAVMVCHRRAGKTVAVIQDLLIRALTHKRPGPPLRYAYIAPTRDQAKDIAWRYLCDFAGKIPGVEINQAELRITLPNAAQIRLYSGENYERMRGLYFDGVVSDEDADIDPAAFTYVIRPCLVDYQGWHTRIGTPKGKNAFWKAYRAAKGSGSHFSLMLRASESGILGADELAEIRNDPLMTPESYAQEMECDFEVGKPGAIYANAIRQAREEGRIGEMPVDGGSLVYTSWDLGAPQNTVVWYWQIVGREIRIIDCDRAFEGTLADRWASMTEKGYRFGGHYLPHDAEQTERSGATVASELERLGMRNMKVVPRTHSVWVGINHLLQLFPSLAFREPECEDGLEALAAYHQKPERDGKLSTPEPVHDWASHSADALRVLAEAHRCGMVEFAYTHAEVEEGDRRRKPRRKRRSALSYLN